MVNSRKGEVVSYIIFGTMALTIILPFLLLLSSSFTDESAIARNGYGFLPSEFSLAAYEYLLKSAATIGQSYFISIIVTVAGTVIGLILTVLCAYPLSRRDLPGRSVLTFFVFFTMLFNGGLVPTYLVYTQIFHIKNHLAALIVPNLLVQAYNVMLAKTFFQTSIPVEISEAARIDGAGELTIFFRVILPLSKPIFATLGLFISVAYWNDWMNGLVYLTDESLFSLQNLLYRMTSNIQFLSTSNMGVNTSVMDLPSQTVRMAIALVGVLPMLAAYPFFQKYFVKGISLGAVKG